MFRMSTARAFSYEYLFYGGIKHLHVPLMEDFLKLSKLCFIAGIHEESEYYFKNQVLSQKLQLVM